jgi:hypothetical protein
LLLLLAFGAGAQPGSRDGAAAERTPRRAPLANVEDIEPAVDVGAPRAASPAPPSPAAQPAAAGVVPAERVAQAAERPAGARVMDSLDLGTTSITGNQELPKVLYIVPWKRSDLGELAGRPVNTLLEEVLAPVDPEVFERHLDYYESLHGESQEE